MHQAIKRLSVLRRCLSRSHPHPHPATPSLRSSVPAFTRALYTGHSSSLRSTSNPTSSRINSWIPTRFSSESSIHRSLTMSAASSSSCSSASDSKHLLERGKHLVADLVLRVLPAAFPDVSIADPSALRSDIIARQAKPSLKGAGDLALPCFVFAKTIKGPPVKTAAALAEAINKELGEKKDEDADIAACAAAGPYLNFTLSARLMSSVIPAILTGDYLKPLPSEGKSKVMIEYSQPNTHKAFHVGHMRNVALGDSLVRLYEVLGHPVVAANYFGDEGAHVAKCLWYLDRWMKKHPDFVLEKDVKEEERGEWLGQMYAASVEALDLATLTRFPFPHVLPAKVLSISKHPAADAPANWNVVSLQISADASTEPVTVVCGGRGYKEGDLVAYLPVGAPIKGKEKGATVQPKDMKGVMSAGIMMASKELGIEEVAAVEPAKPAAADKQDHGGKKEKKEKGAKSNKGKSSSSSSSDSANNQIHILPADLPLGIPVTESGRLSTADISSGTSVLEEHEERKQGVRTMLQVMESGQDKRIADLWAMTKKWSLDEFKRIYSWLDARFDVDFFESECSEPSRLLVEQYRNKVFFDSNGALGADLSKYKLGFCMVLKSDGTGLYATKDLALAKRKFDEYQIDESIYVVDAAQTLHFQQVFKTLELMGYERAKKCVHIPYGQVVLPSGKMSSRTGTVIMFSALKNMLSQDIYQNFLAKYDPNRLGSPEAEAAERVEEEARQAAAQAEGKKIFVKQERNTEKWSSEALENAQHQIAVATIKYGMLSHDVSKDIVFVLDEWTAKSGMTGPYMLYAYARIQSIIREVKVAPDTKVDFSLLNHESERSILALLHELWDILARVAENKNPSTLCTYLFELSKSFSSWYEIPACSVNNAASEELKATRIEFIKAIGRTIQFGLGLLGIKTLERM